METNKVYLGDCLNLMKQIKPKSVDFIFADIPYNTTACDFDKEILPLNRHIMVKKGKKQVPIYLNDYLLDCYQKGIPREQAIGTFEAEAKDGLWDYFKRILKDNGVVAMTASQPFTTKLAMSNISWLKYEWVWNKVNGANFMNLDNRPSKTQEQVLVFSSTPNFTFNPIRVSRSEKSLKRDPVGTDRNKNCRTPSPVSHYGVINVDGMVKKHKKDGKKHPIDIITFNIKDNHHEPAYNNPYGHPTKKPVKLLKYLIKTYTNKGDLILDPTAGSGTTGVAALELNRNFILIEKEPKYFDKIELRLQDTRERLGKIKTVDQVEAGNARQLGLL